MSENLIKSPYMNMDGEVVSSQGGEKNTKIVAFEATELSEEEWNSFIAPEAVQAVKTALLAWYESRQEQGSHSAYIAPRVEKIRHCDPTDYSAIRGLVQMLDLKNMEKLIINLIAVSNLHDDIGECTNPDCKVEALKKAIKVIGDVYATNQAAIIRSKNK